MVPEKGGKGNSSLETTGIFGLGSSDQLQKKWGLLSDRIYIGGMLC